MTSLRRSFSNGVGGAVLIYALGGFGCHTASEPIGKLSREDAISFLVLRDQLQQFRTWPANTILCIAVAASTQSQNGHDDPSSALVARLQETTRASISNVVRSRMSDCEQSDSEPTDKASGKSAVVVYVGKAADSEFVSKNNCGQYLGGWHGGALNGGGNFYTVEENAGTVSVTRTNCQHFE